jgi:hypothetical protein
MNERETARHAARHAWIRGEFPRWPGCQWASPCAARVERRIYRGWSDTDGTWRIVLDVCDEHAPAVGMAAGAISREDIGRPGVWRGACYTPGCTSTGPAATGISFHEVPNVPAGEDPNQRHRCQQCRDSIDTAWQARWGHLDPAVVYVDEIRDTVRADTRELLALSVRDLWDEARRGLDAYRERKARQGG